MELFSIHSHEAGEYIPSLSCSRTSFGSIYSTNISIGGKFYECHIDSYFQNGRHGRCDHSLPGSYRYSILVRRWNSCVVNQ